MPPFLSQCLAHSHQPQGTMPTSHNPQGRAAVMRLGLVLFVTLLLGISSTQLWADESNASASNSQPQTLTTDADLASVITTVTTTAADTTQPGDPIVQFVQGDFAQRQQLLSHWTGSNESFDQLVALLDNNELYQDGAGTPYILENEEILLSYPDRQVLSDWPADLNQVILPNTLRTAMTFGQASSKLASEDSKQRLQAVRILSSNLDAVDMQMLNAAAVKEDNRVVADAIAELQARIQLRSDDPASQLAALEILSDSGNPEVLADINAQLQNDHHSSELKSALLTGQTQVQRHIKTSEWMGHLFSGMSTASILLLAALGLAITYGLLGVINMAHGELIMIGAYATYVVQGLFKSYFPEMLDWYLLAAVPAAFLVSAVVGMVIERIVIQPLYGRQLETLLATFGVSLILMQLVRMLFGAQNVEVSNISWLSGAYQLTPSLALPYSRIAIIGFTVIVLGLLVFLLNKTRFGLFVRAVTQNRQMARAVGIRSARIDMLAFGLGSGLAGLAGCALAQIGNVGPDLGQNYIIDAFLVVVVGGVGQVWGAVLAALGLGISGTVLEIGMGAVMAKIILLVLVILFIQKRPQGLFALKGRFVE